MFIDSAKLDTVVCHSSKIERLLQAGHQCDVLKNVIKIGAPVTPEEHAEAEKLGIKMMSFAELEVSESFASQLSLEQLEASEPIDRKNVYEERQYEN